MNPDEENHVQAMLNRFRVRLGNLTIDVTSDGHMRLETLGECRLDEDQIVMLGSITRTAEILVGRYF